MFNESTSSTKPTIDSLVEQRLRKAQEHKTFRDTDNRVGGSRKETVAFKIISVNQLSELELDPILAAKMVTKDRVWPEFDPLEERERGVEAGAAYLKIKIREALSSKPYDNSDCREVYTKTIGEFSQKLKGALTYDQVYEMAKSFCNISRAYLGDTSNLKKSYTTGYTRNEQGEKVPFERMEPNSRDLEKKQETIYGKRFINLCKVESDAARSVHSDARKKNEVTQAQQDLHLANMIASLQKSIVKNADEAAHIASLSNLTALYEHMLGMYGKMITRQDFMIDPEKGRALMLDRLEKTAARLAQQILEAPTAIPDKYKAHAPDWSWAEPQALTVPAEETAAKKVTVKINTKPPLSHIERTGGLKIDDISVEAIRRTFGFKAVEFGNSINDRKSKESVRHFLGAIADLAEILNLDVQAINKLGGLSIAFGSRGVSGHLATYFPARKIINLSNADGDGSIAHEWAHYFDNICSEQDWQRASYTFASDVPVSNLEMRTAWSALHKFFHTGTGEIITRTVVIPAQSKKRYKITGSTAQEAIEESQKKYSYYRNGDNAKKADFISYFGWIAHSFGVSHIEVSVSSRTSLFMANSTNMGTKYWIEPVELFARAFENFVRGKLLAAGRENNYLVAIHKWGNPKSPYPIGQEAEQIAILIEKLLSIFKVVHSIGDFVPFTTQRQDEYIDLMRPEDANRAATPVLHPSAPEGDAALASPAPDNSALDIFSYSQSIQPSETILPSEAIQPSELSLPGEVSEAIQPSETILPSEAILPSETIQPSIPMATTPIPGEWQSFDDISSYYDLLILHATKANGPILVRYRDGQEVQYFSLRIALFRRHIEGQLDNGDYVDVNYQYATGIKTRMQLPAKFTHLKFVQLLADHKMNFLDSSEDAIFKLFKKEFKLLQIRGGIAEFKFLKDGSLLTMKGDKVKDAFEMLYQMSIRIEAQKKKPWELTLTNYATYHFLNSAATEMAFLGALMVPEESYRAEHQSLVRKALEAGEPVPANVLADYPEVVAAVKEAPKPNPKAAGEIMLSSERTHSELKEEFRQKNIDGWDRDRILSLHKQNVEEAIKEGVKVPVRVLLEYPDLVDKYSLYDRMQAWELSPTQFANAVTITHGVGGKPNVAFHGLVVGYGNVNRVHATLVQRAVAENKLVPATILDYYPELKAPKKVAIDLQATFPKGAFLVVREVRTFDGTMKGYLAAPFNGLEANMIDVASSLSDAMYRSVDGVSNTQSRIFATDASGKPAWVISPNFRRVAAMGTEDAQVIYSGPLLPSTKDRAPVASDSEAEARERKLKLLKIKAAAAAARIRILALNLT